jgi:hypothetical protein
VGKEEEQNENYIERKKMKRQEQEKMKKGG